jgi:hypothetical protein
MAATRSNPAWGLLARHFGWSVRQRTQSLSFPVVIQLMTILANGNTGNPGDFRRLVSIKDTTNRPAFKNDPRTLSILQLCNKRVCFAIDRIALLVIYSPTSTGATIASVNSSRSRAQRQLAGN